MHLCLCLYASDRSVHPQMTAALFLSQLTRISVVQPNDEKTDDATTTSPTDRAVAILACHAVIVLVLDSSRHHLLSSCNTCIFTSTKELFYEPEPELDPYNRNDPYDGRSNYCTVPSKGLK